MLREQLICQKQKHCPSVHWLCPKKSLLVNCWVIPLAPTCKFTQMHTVAHSPGQLKITVFQSWWRQSSLYNPCKSILLIHVNPFFWMTMVPGVTASSSTLDHLTRILPSVASSVKDIVSTFIWERKSGWRGGAKGSVWMRTSSTAVRSRALHATPHNFVFQGGLYAAGKLKSSESEEPHQSFFQCLSFHLCHSHRGPGRLCKLAKCHRVWPLG